ncbi:MAG: hypothetical protein HDS38_05885 [Bacteroides sp.]|nr:hypothetical protein [Bacteroides sp.]
MEKRNFMCCIFLILATMAYAQIGYQVSLLNNATGEARSNERVTVTVKITDSEGKTVCEETKNETSNDFGVISMSVGDSETFTNADWSKLPFFIEASIDGRLLGKSQLLSVPVAEYAKKSGGGLTKEILMSKVWYNEDESGYSIAFKENTVYCYHPDGGVKYYFNKYRIDGNFVFIYDGHYADDDNPYRDKGLYLYDGDRLLPILALD